MLCSFITDPIAVEVECGKCLCEIKRMRDRMKSEGCYIVLLESTGKMLYSLSTDLNAGKVEFGQCLCEAVRKLL